MRGAERHIESQRERENNMVLNDLEIVFFL